MEMIQLHRTIIYNNASTNLMNNQFFVAIGVAVVASVLMTGLASTINAQSNMTGANMTGANMTGANMTGANMTGANIQYAVWNHG